MKTKVRTTILAVTCIAPSLLIGFCVGSCVHHPQTAFTQEADAASAPDGAGHSSTKAHPRLSQKTKHVDLEGGVTLVEITGESDDGDVWLCASFLYHSGEEVLMKNWDKFMGKNKTGRNASQMYYHKGRLVLLEADEDGDGAPDLLILFDGAEAVLQAFNVKKDGVLSPVSNDRLKKMKHDWKFGTDVIKPMVEGVKNATSERERRRIVEDAIEKAQKAGGKPQ